MNGVIWILLLFAFVAGVTFPPVQFSINAVLRGFLDNSTISKVAIG